MTEGRSAMQRWMVLLVFAAPVRAQDAEKAGGDDMIPWIPAGRIARGERDAPTVFVRLREGGALQVKAGEEWKDATLDDVGKFLRSFTEEQDREMRKGGKSAYETLPGGAKASRLFVSIDVEPTVPWQNVQWLMTVVAEQRYYRLEVSEGKRRMLVSLPTDAGSKVEPKDPPAEILISVHAVARAEKEGKWGDLPVLRPAEVRYKIGNAHEEASTQADVADYVRKAWAAVKDTPNCTISGEIKAGNKVPFSLVFDLMETFEARGIASMKLFAAQIPSAAVRAAPRLPYPLKNYDATN